MVENNSYKELAFKRFKNFICPVLDCSLVSKDNFVHLNEILKEYNRKNNMSFCLNEEKREIFDSNMKTNKKHTYDSFLKMENLLNHLEEKGFHNITFSESKKSDKEEEVIMNEMNKSYESQFNRAEIVLASRMIVDELQKIIKSISSLLYDDVFFISDKIKLSYGKKTSDYWFNNVKSHLEKLINTSIETKEKISKLNFILEKSEEIEDLNDMAVDSIEIDDSLGNKEEEKGIESEKEKMLKIKGEENDEEEFRKLKNNIKDDNIKEGSINFDNQKDNKNKKRKEMEALKTFLEDLRDGIEFKKAFESACLITGIKKKTLINLIENYITTKKKNQLS